MTLTDVIILIIVGLILFGVVYSQVKHKDEKACNACSYSKSKMISKK